MNTKKYMPPLFKKNQAKSKERLGEQTKGFFELKEELFPVLKNNENDDDKTISKKNIKIINYTTMINSDLNKSLSTPLNDDTINDDTINDDTINDDNTNKPGWIYIQKNKSDGTIEYKYGPEVINDELFYKNEKYLDMCNLRYRIARLQWDRDREIDHLGDISYYYNKPTIRQMLESARYDNKSIKRKKINVRMTTATATKTTKTTINYIKNKEMKIMENDDENEDDDEEDVSLSSDSAEDN